MVWQQPPALFPLEEGNELPFNQVTKQGIVVTEVTSTTALVWIRTEQPTLLDVEVLEVVIPNTGELRENYSILTSAQHDFIEVVPLRGLVPQTAYAVRVLLPTEEALTPVAPVAIAKFTTAPLPETEAPVEFVWGGDIGGQGYCRKPHKGYEIFDQLRAGSPDFGILLGDLIYGDGRCPSPPNVPGSDFVATSLKEFRAKHRYQREDPAFQKFLASVPIYAMWDDHEARNDFSGSTDPLMPSSRQAFLQYWPIDVSRPQSHRLYRRIHRGANLDVFFLDTRQYRSSNRQVDGSEKTMLGQEQLQWLFRALRESRATWKIIVSSVPLSLQKGGSRQAPANDSWALGRGQTGFARERDQIVDLILTHKIANVVWLSTDVHFAQAVAYDPNRDGTIDFHEFICGPLSAKPFNPWLPEASLHPTVLYQEGGFQNFGHIDIQRHSLKVRLIDESGMVRFHHRVRVQD